MTPEKPDMTPEEKAKLDRETELAEDDLDRVHGGFIVIIPVPPDYNPSKPSPPVKVTPPGPDPNPRGAMPCE